MKIAGQIISRVIGDVSALTPMDRFHSRLCAGIILAVICATTLLFIVWWFLAAERTLFGALAFIATTSIYSVCLLIFHATKNRLLACHLFVAILATSIFMATTLTGGTDSPVVAILIIVPVLAVLMGGSRSGAIWFGFTLLAYAGQTILSLLDVSIPMLLQSANRSFLQPALWVAGTSVIFISLLVLLRANTRLSHSLYNSKQRFEELAHTDVTTGLYNRRYFELRMSSLIDCDGTKQSPFSLLYFDLNNFKAVNDSHGHQVGDLLLRHAGNLLRMTFRTSDSIFRMGGDEFAVIVESDLTDAATERLLKELEKSCLDPLVIAGKKIRVSASTGIANFPEDGIDTDALLNIADSAMYADKLQFRKSDIA